MESWLCLVDYVEFCTKLPRRICQVICYCAKIDISGKECATSIYEKHWNRLDYFLIDLLLSAPEDAWTALWEVSDRQDSDSTECIEYATRDGYQITENWHGGILYCRYSYLTTEWNIQIDTSNCENYQYDQEREKQLVYNPPF